MDDIEVIKSWDAGGWFTTCSYKYSVGDGYVTNIQPMNGIKLKINGRDWLDCYNKRYSLDSFQQIVLMMGSNLTLD